MKSEMHLHVRHVEKNSRQNMIVKDTVEFIWVR